jgi:hypothetical protein
LRGTHQAGWEEETSFQPEKIEVVIGLSAGSITNKENDSPTRKTTTTE